MKAKFPVAAALAGLAFAAQESTAAVVLVGNAPSPVNTYSSYPSTSPLNLAAAGNVDYFGLVTVTRGAATITQTDPAGTNFGALSLVEGSNAATPTYRLGGSSFGVFVTDPVGNYSGYAFNQNETYVAANGATDGVALTYNLPAGSTETINYYLGSFDSYYEYSLTTAVQTGALASVTTPTGLATGDNAGSGGTPGAGYGHSDGVLSFTLTNTDLTASAPVTFTLYYGGANGSSSGVGLAAATVQVPEPMTLSFIGLAGMGLTLRRRRLI